MNSEITKLIEQYLSGEISAQDREVLENRMVNNKKLREEVAFQQTIHEAAKRSAVRTEVLKTSKQFHLNQKFKWGGLGLGLMTLLSFSIWFAADYLGENKKLDLKEFTELTSILEQNSAIDRLKSEFFAWNGLDTAMLSKDGVLISIPSDAFLLNGKPYTNPALIQWQEALDGASIVKAGLSTMSDEKLLETQGMFSFSATTPEGKQLTINPKTGIYVQVPVNEFKEGMMLFDGEKDKNGMINWIKPRALEKIPLAVPMPQLDFYPPGYEDKLNELKARVAKKYRDSLYLSFEENNNEKNISNGQNIKKEVWPEEVTQKSMIPKNKNTIDWKDKIQWSFNVEYLPNSEANIIGKATLKEGWHIFSVNHDPTKADFTGIPTIFILPSVPNVLCIDELKDGKKPLIKKDELGTSLFFENEAIFKQKVKLLDKTYFEYKFQYSFQLCDEEGCIFPPVLTAIVQFNGSASSTEDEVERGYIPPSSVLAFWNPTFNNTLLSTREFEIRMRSVHQTCAKKVLDVYTKNMSAPMHELDQKVADMGYSKFQQFAAENVGALKPNDPHVKGLQAFYERGIAQLKAEEKRNREKEQKRRNDWDQEVSKERGEEISRTVKRESKVFVEEYNLNHKNVRRQLGRVLGARIYGSRPVSNIDKFVLETTLARKTAEFYDKETGKTARIQYNDFSFSITNYKEYTQVFAYLFPDKLNSYHRLNGRNGSFNFPLNDEVIYDLAIVAITEKGYSYTQLLTVKGGNLGELKLDRVSESKLDASIKLLNNKRGVNIFNVQDELKWLVKEQHNYVEQKKRSDNQLFRSQLQKIVFPCYVSDSVVNSVQQLKPK